MENDHSTRRLVAVFAFIGVAASAAGCTSGGSEGQAPTYPIDSTVVKTTTRVLRFPVPVQPTGPGSTTGLFRTELDQVQSYGDFDPPYGQGGAEPVHRPPAAGRDLLGQQHLHLLAGHALHAPGPRRGQQHVVQRAPLVHRRHRRPEDHPELGRPSRGRHGRLPDAVPGGGARQVDPVLPGDRQPRSLPDRVVPRVRGPVARSRRGLRCRHGQPQEPGASGASRPVLPGGHRRSLADRRDRRSGAGRVLRQPAEGGGRSRPPFPPQDGVDPGVLRHHVQPGRPRLRARRPGSTGGIRLLQLPARSGRAAQGDRPHDTQSETDGSKDIHGHGYLDANRWAWLQRELEAGQAANQLMIIAAHIPIGVAALASGMEWWDSAADPDAVEQNAAPLTELVAKLQATPNVLVWLAGHRHYNVVKAFPPVDPLDRDGAPWKGFWQVETSSLRDHPQQFRTFEIILNVDYTVSIVTTMVSYLRARYPTTPSNP